MRKPYVVESEKCWNCTDSIVATLFEKKMRQRKEADAVLTDNLKRCRGIQMYNATWVTSNWKATMNSVCG